MTEIHTFKGSCLCGAVGFELRPPTLWCAHCHCGMCRRAHGAAFVTWIGVPETGFKVVAGEAQLGWYASSDEARRGFCRQCGSSMFFQSSRWPGEMHVALANMEGEIDRKPSAHVFYQAHVSWYEPGDSLPRKP